jgi:MoaA/NifB/PqqE/SkfB family radical SAM enzyme
MHAKKKGFLITLFTNGTKIDKRTADLLSKYPPFLVEISLYGTTRETYEEVTRASGSHKRCMEGIQRMLGAGIKLRLKSMALAINQHEIEAMDKMSQELGCEFRFDPMLNKRIDDNNFSDPVKYRIPLEDVVRLDKAFPKRIAGWKKFCDKFVGEMTRDDRLYKCGAGIGIIHVNPYGIALKGGLLETVRIFTAASSHTPDHKGVYPESEKGNCAALNPQKYRYKALY